MTVWKKALANAKKGNETKLETRLMNTVGMHSVCRVGEGKYSLMYSTHVGQHLYISLHIITLKINGSGLPYSGFVGSSDSLSVMFGGVTCFATSTSTSTPATSDALYGLDLGVSEYVCVCV